jgi:tetratricopeptide (TPR) repeat protein
MLQACSQGLRNIGALAAACMLAFTAGAAGADELVLKDGRVFVGVVTEANGQAVIEMDMGTLAFPLSEVSSITIKPTPKQELETRLAKARPGNVDDLLNVSRWAQRQGLRKEAAGLLRKIIEIEPDHATARAGLGFVKVAGKWITVDAALEAARARLDTDGAEAVLGELVPAMETAAGPEQLPAVRELQASALLRVRKFDEAARAYGLIAGTTGALAIRAAVMSDILARNKDGMYVLTEPYPPAAALTSSKPVLEPGPKSLSDPQVVRAALRDRARQELSSVQAIFAEAAKLEASDTEAAVRKYMSAEGLLDRAEALVEGIAYSYRVEIARKRIEALRRGAESDARKFDQQTRSLGKTDMPPQEYRNMIVRMMGLLDNIVGDLKTALTIAKPYPQELVLEIKWAELDLKRIEGLKETLKAELDAKD